MNEYILLTFRRGIIYNYEEWEASDSGHMPHIWDQDVQDREELGQVLQISGVVFERLGIFIRFTQPFHY